MPGEATRSPCRNLASARARMARLLVHFMVWRAALAVVPRPSSCSPSMSPTSLGRFRELRSHLPRLNRCAHAGSSEMTSCLRLGHKLGERRGVGGRIGGHSSGSPVPADPPCARHASGQDLSERCEDFERTPHADHAFLGGPRCWVRRMRRPWLQKWSRLGVSSSYRDGGVGCFFSRSGHVALGPLTVFRPLGGVQQTQYNNAFEKAQSRHILAAAEVSSWSFLAWHGLERRARRVSTYTFEIQVPNKDAYTGPGKLLQFTELVTVVRMPSAGVTFQARRTRAGWLSKTWGAHLCLDPQPVRSTSM